MAVVPNVRVERVREGVERSRVEADTASVAIDLAGEWRSDDGLPQFGAAVRFPAGEQTFEADFPAFLGGEGRAPSPLAYCFYGALACYASTYAVQAALAGVALRGLRARVRVRVDFRAALGVAEVPPLDAFDFEVSVDSDANDEDLARVKRLADERCPAIWALGHLVPYRTAVARAASLGPAPAR